ncbi:MAG: BrnT family toxin [Elusimicrobia bacterium]|nr:BrnT family toxin [Elusimicrobiota bacterium]
MTVFYDPLSATFDDPDHSADEQRLITVGYSPHGRLLVVSHAERGKAMRMRIIGARTATSHERRRHER